MKPHEDLSVDEIWQRQEEGYQKILQGEIKNLEHAFQGPEKPTVCCIDEGICRQDTVHAAGSLVTIPLEEAAQFIKKSNATALTSHEGCGAINQLYVKEKPAVSLDEFT